MSKNISYYCQDCDVDVLIFEWLNVATCVNCESDNLKVSHFD